MSISNDTPNEESTPHEFATIEKDEQPFQSSPASKTWGMTGIVMATIFFVALLIIGVTAERSLHRLAPEKTPPTTSMVVEQQANTPTATPAYPTVYVQQSTDPNQAPSPLPETPIKTK